MKALLIVDMIHDFVDGKFGSEGAMKIVEKIKMLAEKFRKDGMVVYLKDSHTSQDPQLKVWGEHAMRGTLGSEIVEELSPKEEDVVVEKRTYDGFLFTSLEKILKERDVDEIYICGVATNICVLHTAFGAFARGFKINVVEDACSGTSEEEHRRAIEYMRKIYGAKIVRSEEL